MVKEYIQIDLQEYDQDRPVPESLTFVYGDCFRHYEFGDVFGIVLYNSPSDKSNLLFTIIKEDDGFWFVSENNVANILFLHDLQTLLGRTQAWIYDHVSDYLETEYRCSIEADKYKDFIRKLEETNDKCPF